MLMKDTFLTTCPTFLAMVFGCGLSIAQPSAALSNAVSRFADDSLRRAPETIAAVEEVLRRATDPQDRLSAKTLLVQCLSDKATELPQSERDRMVEVSREIVRENSNSWQAVVAEFTLIAECGFSGHRNEQIALAQQALQHTDFGVFERAQDAAATAVKSAYGGRPFILREGIKLMLANAFCDDGQVTEAEKVLATVEDANFATVIRNRIDLARREQQLKAPMGN